jgi:hypothetical protein
VLVGVFLKCAQDACDLRRAAIERFRGADDVHEKTLAAFELCAHVVIGAIVHHLSLALQRAKD